MNDKVSLVNVMNLWVWEFVQSRSDIYVSFPVEYIVGEEYTNIFIAHRAYVHKFQIIVHPEHVELRWPELGKGFKTKDTLTFRAVNPNLFKNIEEMIERWISKNAQSAGSQSP